MKLTNFLSRALLLAGVAVFSLTFAACGGSDDDDPTPDTPTWDPTTETRPDATALSGLLKGKDGKYYLMTKYGSREYTYNGQWIEYINDYEWSPGKFTSPTATYSYTLDGKGRIETLRLQEKNTSGSTEYDWTTKFTYNAYGVSSATLTGTEKYYWSDGQLYETVDIDQTTTYTWKDGDITEEKTTTKRTSHIQSTGSTTSRTSNVVYTYTYSSVENTSGQIYPALYPHWLIGSFMAGLSSTKHELASYVRKQLDRPDDKDLNYTTNYEWTYNNAGLISEMKYTTNESGKINTNIVKYGYTEYTKK
ncbi:MAG: hypothetical protein J6M53_03740 [Bacteroidaceae bacterium]|nr:hypothetical protein [Bacteroidaceae bacterium]